MVILFCVAFGKHDGGGEERHPGGRDSAAKGQRGETHGRGVCVCVRVCLHACVHV